MSTRVAVDDTSGTVRTGTVLLEVRHMVKRFGALAAIDDVSFTVRAGEVHALLGENGAGKSTLVKMLYGVHRPDGGEIFIGTEHVQIGSPAMARDLGLGSSPKPATVSSCASRPPTAGCPTSPVGTSSASCWRSRWASPRRSSSCPIRPAGSTSAPPR